MKSVRRKLTYANVMSSLAVFLVLGGATAFAAGHLAKNSVGPNQLKNGSVSTAKLKNGAVTGAKIGGGAVGGGQLADGSVGTGKLANGAVATGKIADRAVSGVKIGGSAVGGENIAPGAINTGKLADGAVTGAKIETASVPFGRLVNTISGSSSAPATENTPYPLSNPTYTQPTGEVDQYVGAAEVHFPASCNNGAVNITLLLDGTTIGQAFPGQKGSAEGMVTAQFSPIANKTLAVAATSSSQPHSFEAKIGANNCAAANVTGVQIDVLGTK